jgi:hypothetical protein
MSLVMSIAVSLMYFHILTISAEIFPTHIRPQGMAWSLVGTFLSTLVYVELAPTALGRIQWRYYIVFICLTFANVVILYFWCPEVSLQSRVYADDQTKGLSLEEIAGRFGDEVIVHINDTQDVDHKALRAQMDADKAGVTHHEDAKDLRGVV